MNNLIPLPAGPFFCVRDGRYLPGLTDLIIEAAAMLQRQQIQEQLFKLRLKQKCFVALAERAPQALTHFPVAGADVDMSGTAVAGCGSAAVPAPVSISKRHSLKIFPFPGGPVDDGFKPGASPAAPSTCPGLTILDETVTNDGKIRADRAASVFDFYPKGRW
jgi:hypothetical protein